MGFKQVEPQGFWGLLERQVGWWDSRDEALFYRQGTWVLGLSRRGDTSPTCSNPRSESTARVDPWSPSVVRSNGPDLHPPPGSREERAVPRPLASNQRILPQTHRHRPFPHHMPHLPLARHWMAWHMMPVHPEAGCLLWRSVGMGRRSVADWSSSACQLGEHSHSHRWLRMRWAEWGRGEAGESAWPRESWPGVHILHLLLYPSATRHLSMCVQRSAGCTARPSSDPRHSGTWRTWACWRAAWGWPRALTVRAIQLQTRIYFWVWRASQDRELS